MPQNSTIISPIDYSIQYLIKYLTLHTTNNNKRILQLKKKDYFV